MWDDAGAASKGIPPDQHRLGWQIWAIHHGMQMAVRHALEVARSRRAALSTDRDD